jgi:hypothetical protein
MTHITRINAKTTSLSKNLDQMQIGNTYVGFKNYIDGVFTPLKVRHIININRIVNQYDLSK